MAKKKFAETKIAKFLKEKAPDVLNSIGDILPSQGTFGLVKNIITSDTNIEPEDKEKVNMGSDSNSDLHENKGSPIPGSGGQLNKINKRNKNKSSNVTTGHNKKKTSSNFAKKPNRFD